MITALSIIAAILAVSGLIVLHEAGHMWAARRLGMRVERFSVGFGPVLWSTVRDGTEYAVSALPLGGYVKIAGMAATDDISPDDQTAYCNKPAWRRVLVLAAGPGANYVVAVLLAVGLLATVGLPAPDGSSRVGELTPGMPGALAGLQVGDRIVSVDGKPVADWYALVAELQRHPGQEVELAVERGEPARPQPLRLTPKDDGGVGRVGFRPFTVRHQLGPVAAVVEGFSATNARAWDNLVGLAPGGEAGAEGRAGRAARHRPGAGPRRPARARTGSSPSSGTSPSRWRCSTCCRCRRSTAAGWCSSASRW